MINSIRSCALNVVRKLRYYHAVRVFSEKQQQKVPYEQFQLVHIATFACSYIVTYTTNVKWAGPLYLFSRNCNSNFHINHPSILEATVIQKEHIDYYAAFSSSTPPSCLFFSFFSYLCGPPILEILLPVPVNPVTLSLSLFFFPSGCPLSQQSATS